LTDIKKKILNGFGYPTPVSAGKDFRGNDAYWFVEFWHKFDLARRKEKEKEVI